MQSDLPFYEGPEDALRAAVEALGGAKQVGPQLWPDKSVDSASRALLDCINAARSEKLTYSQVMMVFMMARSAGFHAPFIWYSNQIGYEPRPIVPAEEEDRLLTVIEQATKTQAAAIAALERISRGRAK